MRRFFGVVGNLLCVALVAACAFFLFAVLHSPMLKEGESHTFYLGESSSAPAVSANSPLAKLESAVYRGDRYTEFSQKFGAKLLFTEQVDGATSYYLYSPALGGGVSLKGEKVNLQIAVGGGQTVVGTPLIFGSW